jgi:hypothetical protein
MANRRRQKRKQLKAKTILTRFEVKPPVQIPQMKIGTTTEKTLLQRWLIPSKRQWNGWGLFTKFCYVTGCVTVIGVLIAIYFGLTGATKALQVEQGKKQDANTDLTTAIKADIESIKKKMGILDNDQGLTWSNRYPNGYTLVTLLHGIKQVIPFRDFIGDVKVQWETFYFQYYPNRILITLPNMTFSNNLKFDGNKVELARIPGSIAEAAAFVNLPDIMVELAASEQYGDVIVIGLYPHIGRKP